MPSSPAIAQLELAVRLKAMRRSRAIEVATITQELNFTRNYWSAVENARTILAEDRLRALLNLFGCSPEESAELLALRDAARERGWWQADHIREPLQRFYGLEHGASRIRAYEGAVINGLLQTPDYARALLASDPSTRPLDIDRSVEIRMRRQERLTDPTDHLDLAVVMTQGVLLQHVAADPTVQPGQLRHLLALIATTNIDLRIVPFTHPTGGALLGAATMYLLDFDSSYLSTIAWQETLTDLALNEDEATIRFLDLSYQKASDGALNREGSAALIEDCLRTLERLT